MTLTMTQVQLSAPTQYESPIQPHVLSPNMKDQSILSPEPVRTVIEGSVILLRHIVVENVAIAESETLRGQR